MKKKILLILLSFFLYDSMIQASRPRKRALRSFGIDDDDDDESFASNYLNGNSGIGRKKDNDSMSIADINKRLEILGEQIVIAKGEPDRQKKLTEDEDYYRDLLRKKESQQASFSNATQQGISKALIGRAASDTDTLPTIFAQAITHKFFKPMGDVVTEKGLTFWGKVFDGIEGGVTFVLSLLGFTETITLNDIMRWQINCQSLSDIYKELRKSIETSESRTTSMQLRSLLQDGDEDTYGPKEEKIIVDLSWEQKRKSDLILLKSMIFKLKIKQYESSKKNYDLHAAIDRLQNDLVGLIDQIESANTLRDLIDATRKDLMISYFSSIDAGLVELGMIIAPDEFNPSRSKKKKTSAYGHGAYSDF